MALRILIVFLGLVVLGCSSRSETLEDMACYTDLDCPSGTRCDPWQQRCVGPPIQSDRDATASSQDARNGSKDAVSTCVEGQSCNDSNLCTFGDKCTKDGVCKGTEYSCDDGFDCTIDSCDGVGGCRYVMAAGQCLINAKCIKSGEANPLNSCQECLPSVSTNKWSNDDNNTCEDGNKCTTNDICVGGKCAGGEAPDCADDVPCTDDSCTPESGCTHTPNSILCDDGVDCTADTCDLEKGCASEASDTLCDDGHSCTSGVCDAEKGCMITADDALCDDKIACTQDSCLKEKGCINAADNVLCDDNDSCTNDSCDPEKGCQNTDNGTCGN